MFKTSKNVVKFLNLWRYLFETRLTIMYKYEVDQIVPQVLDRWRHQSI